MAFWGTIISRKFFYIHCDHDHRTRLRITQASLGLTSNDNISKEKVIVFCENGRSRFLLCVLVPGSVESLNLALEVKVKEDLKILVIGDHKVCLSGYYHSGQDRFPVIGDKSHTVRKDMLHLESTVYSGSEEDDYDYEDGFIVDDRDPRDYAKRKSSKQRSCGDVEVNNEDKKSSNTSVKPNVKPEAVWRKQLTPKFEL